MSQKVLMLVSLVMAIALVLGGCASPTPEPTEVPTEPPAAEATEPPAEEEEPEGLGFPGEMADKTWEEIVAEAEGQKVQFWHWGGDDNRNAFWHEYVGGKLKEEYGVTMEPVPVSAPTEFVDKILAEASAGVDEGSVDLVWINGENFKTVRQADALYGPFSYYLPNGKYIDWDDSAYQYDFGYPVEGYESVLEAGQVVLIYDEARVSDPPQTIEELKQWAMDNPGKFTYTAPPEFTGTAFLTSFFYHTTGGHEQWLGEVTDEMKERFAQEAQKTWDWLEEIEPYLWREGETYPESITQIDDLFANGVVDFTISYNTNYADNMIEQGRFPETAKSLVLEEGTVFNYNFVAIPKTAPNKAAALVMANLLLEPEVQYYDANPENLGMLPGIDLEQLPPEWQERFEQMPLGEASVPLDELSAHRVPPLNAELLPLFEQGWEQNVLEQ